jgi:hypothetical protein
MWTVPALSRGATNNGGVAIVVVGDWPSNPWGQQMVMITITKNIASFFLELNLYWKEKQQSILQNSNTHKIF